MTRQRIADDYGAIRARMRELRPEPAGPIMTATEVEARKVDYARRWIMPQYQPQYGEVPGLKELLRKYEAAVEKMFMQPVGAKRVISTAPGTVNSAPKDTITMQSILDACAEAKRIVYENPLAAAIRRYAPFKPYAPLHENMTQSVSRELALLSYVEVGDDGE